MNHINGSGGLTGMLVCAAVRAAVGAGVALLFAPCSGRETRELLARKAATIEERSKNVIEHGRQAIASAKGEERAFSSGSASRTLG
jgi:gas vesicle protein